MSTKTLIFLAIIYISPGLSQIWPSGQSEEEMDIHFLLFLQNKTLDLTNRTYNQVDPRRQTVVLIYGWLTSFTTDQYVINVARKYQAENEYNVIYIDWSTQSYYNYVREVFSTVMKIGTKVGEMIMMLIDRGVSVKKLHLIGFSLGAHVCGFASRYISEHHPQNQTVRRITGLDPAGPLFGNFFGWFSNPYSLNAKDADIVDVTHTDGSFFGLPDKIGTVDFYLNGGSLQISCGQITPNDWTTIFTVNGCSHVFSVLFYMFTVNNVKYRASSDPTQCKDVIVYGDKFAGKATGVYYLQANPIPPYRTQC